MSDKPAPATGVKLDLGEFRLGWRILLVATLGVAVNSNSSLLYAFGTLMLPLQQSFNWTRADLQSAVSFLFMGSIIGSQIVGWLNLRFGMRRVTMVSLVCLGLGFLALTRMGPSIVSLYALLIAISLASMGTMQVTWTHLVNLWFERNRGLALALVLSGTGLAAMVIPTAVSACIARWGWPSALWFLATLPVVLVLPLAYAWMDLPVRRPAQRHPAPEANTAVADPRPAARNAAGVPFRRALGMARFWALNLALSMVVSAVVTLVTNTVPLLRDKGLDAPAAGSVFGSFGASLILGRVVVGYLVDRLWAPGVAAVALALPALGCLLLAMLGPRDTAGLVLAVMLIGMGAGAEFDIAAFLVARYFGVLDYGRLFGVHLGLITLASTLAPWLFGQLYRHTGSYDAMLATCGPMFLVGALMLLPLGAYPRFSPPPTA